MRASKAPLGDTLCHRISNLRHTLHDQDQVLDDLIAHYGEAALRQALLENIGTEPGDDESHRFFVMAFRRLGVEGCCEQVLARALNREMPLTSRFLFFEILWQTNSLSKRDLKRFRHRDLLGFHELRLRHLMRGVFYRPALAAQLLLIHQKFSDEDHRAASFYKVDQLRREEGLPAAIAYRDFNHPDLDPLLSRLAVEAMGREGGEVGRFLLRETRVREKSRGMRNLIDRALEDWPADRGGQRIDADAGRAFVTRCDERTEVACLIVLPRSETHRDLFWAQLNACGLTEAGAMLAIGSADCEERVREFRELGRGIMAEFPVPQAADLVTSAWENTLPRRTALSPLPAAVAARLEQVAAPLRLPGRARPASLDCEALLSFLDGHPVEAWLDLGRPGDGARTLIWALTVSSAWYQFAGERELAELAAYLADEFDETRSKGKFRGEGRLLPFQAPGPSEAVLCSA